MGQSADQAVSIGWLNVQSLRNKTDAVEELVRDRSLDALALIETWHTDSDDICLRLATPEGYAIAEVARPRPVALAAASPSSSTSRSSAPAFQCQAAARSKLSACDTDPPVNRSLQISY